MKIDEAINILKQYIDYDNPNVPDFYTMEEAIKVIIEALEQEPCEDCVSRQAVIDAAIDGADKWDGGFNREREKCIREEIDKLPPVSPQPKMGHWIDIMVGDMPAQRCDRCNTFYPLAYTGGGHKFCPNCGTRMVEPQEGSDKE